jgi:hypothetical protein
MSQWTGTDKAHLTFENIKNAYYLFGAKAMSVILLAAK